MTSDLRRSERATEAFGCDRCGHQKAAHRGDELACPHSPHGASRWREPYVHYIDDGHRLAARLHYDSFVPALLCGDSCTKPMCWCCGEEGQNDPDPECSECGGSGLLDECALQAWWNDDPAWAMEQTDWAANVDLPVPIIWFGAFDDFGWRPRDAA